MGKLKKILTAYSEWLFTSVLLVELVALSFPFPFPVLAVASVIYFLISIIIIRQWIFSRLMILFLMVSLAFGWGMFNSDREFHLILSEGFYALMFALLPPLILAQLNSREKLLSLQENFLRGSFIIAFLISLMGLVKFHFLLKGIQINYFQDGDQYPWGTSLRTDYNMYSLTLLIGLVGGCFMKKNKILRRLFNIGSFIIILGILLCGSRRGFIVLLTLAAVSMIVSILTIFRKDRSKTFPFTPFTVNVFIFAALISSFTLWFIRSDAQSKLTVINCMNYTCGDFLGSTSQLLYRYSGITGHPINTLAMQSDLCGSGSGFIQPQEEAGIDGGRIERWSFAFDILRSASVTKRIWGDGFNYLPLFGKKFLPPDKSDAVYDYPHNFVIASLLYSGFVGCMFVILLLSRTLLIFWLSKKEFLQLMMCGLIVFFYASLSGNSIFSIHILMLLLLLSIPVRLTSLQRDPSSPQ